MSELRWNPLLGEWVATATHRQDRTFLPPADYCPLCPTRPGGFPTEVAERTYDIAVFENRFPSLKSDPPEPAIEGTELYPVRPGRGVCEVVLYTPNHTSTLASEPVEQIYKLTQVWTDRFRELGALPFVDYVFVFENKGEAIGVTLHHPHGQIYAYPFVPPRVARELAQSRAHRGATGRCLVCDIVAEEKRDGRRVVAENESFVAYVPFFARYPYEVHVASTRHLQALTDMRDEELRGRGERLVAAGHQVPGAAQRHPRGPHLDERAAGELVGDGVEREQGDAETDGERLADGAVGAEGEGRRVEAGGGEVLLGGGAGARAGLAEQPGAPDEVRGQW